MFPSLHRYVFGVRLLHGGLLAYRTGRNLFHLVRFSKTKVHLVPGACHTQITDSLTNFDYSVRLTGSAGMRIVRS